MNRKISAALVAALLLCSNLCIPPAARAQASADAPAWMKDSLTKLEAELAAKHGASQRERAARGLRQVADFWRAEDGDAGVFEEFVRANFAGDRATLDTMFARFQHNLEQLNGHMGEIGREFRTQADLDRGAILPFDDLFNGYDPGAHLSDDFFRNKLAFVVLLNFPLTTLEQRLREGERWSRRQWAETALALGFSKRFPAKMRLLTHWNLRDQIKADYGGGAEGLARQRAVRQVLERIVTQTIPAA